MLDRSVEERLRLLLEHLGIDRAHFAGRLPRDWVGLAKVFPKMVSSLILIGPSTVDEDALRSLSSTLLVVHGDQGVTAERVQRTVGRLSGARFVALRDYSILGWTDLTVERADEISTAMLDFLERAEGQNGQSAPRAVPPEGEVAGISYRVRGSGPPLVLLPLWLSPSQWEPLVPRLATRYTTVTLGGPALGAVAILESRGRAAGYRRMLRTLIDETDLQPGERLLEVGSGTGVIGRWLASYTGGRNPIVGIDINRYLLREAAALARRDRLDATIDFREGSAESLPFPDSAFDVTMSVTVIEEVDADRMLAEMVRVTKPRGRVAVIARALDVPLFLNVSLTASLKVKAEAPIGVVAQSGCADTSLYRRMHQAGLTTVKMFPQLPEFGSAETDMMQFMEGLILARLEPGEIQEWRRARAQAEAEGTFFLTWPHHCAVGIKP